MQTEQNFMFDCTDGIRIRIRDCVEEMEPPNYLVLIGEGNNIIYRSINEMELDNTLKILGFNILNERYINWKYHIFE